MVLYLLFFVSGFCGLLYEVVWSRMLVLVIGNTSLASSVILASFMTGLSLGSYFWGRFTRNRSSRLPAVFGLLEIGVGISALAVPSLIGLVPPVEHWISSATSIGSSQAALLRYALCFVLFLPPTFLMGGTFAVIGEHIIGRRSSFGPRASFLYGLNTLGGALGAFAAGFFLIRLYGHTGSPFLGACLNFVIGSAALGVQWNIGRGDKKETVRESSETGTSSPTADPDGTTVYLALFGAFLSGFCALAFEVIWTRLLIPVVDNSVYSFTIVLVAFLTGIALGGFLNAAVFSRVGRPLLIFAAAQIMVGASTLLFPFFVDIIQTDPGLPYTLVLLKRLPIFILVPTILMGVSLPLAAQVFNGTTGKAGASIGTVFALNTIGGVIGAVAAGFFLIPVVGIQKSSLILASTGVAVGCLILAVKLRRVYGAAALATFLLFVWAGISFTPKDYIRSKYAKLNPQSDLIYYSEGIAATVNIFQGPDGIRSLYINGIPELDTSLLSVKTFRIMGALPGLLHENPSNALMITFGAGITAGTAERFANRLDCVDLVEQGKEIAGYFSLVNNRIAENKRFFIFADDGRHYLQTSDRRYSIIVSDASHPRTYDSWVLFTKEFYESVKKRLTPDGVFCQWLPFHGLDTEQYLSIVRTFSEVFPHTSIWTVGEAYSLLLAVPKPFEVDFARLRTKLGDPSLRFNLKPFGLDNPFALLSHFAMAEEKVKKMTAAVSEPIADNNPAHLFFPVDAGLRKQYEEWPLANFRTVNAHRESIAPYLRNIGDTEEERARTVERMRAYEARRGVP